MNELYRTSFRNCLSLLAALTLIAGCPTAVCASAPDAASESAAAAVKPERLQVGSSTMSMRDAAGRSFKGLAYTVAALGLALSLIKRVKGSAKSGPRTPIEIVARRSLSSRVSLVVVEVEGRRLLLSQGPEDARLITELGSGRDGFEDLLGSDEGFVEELPRAVHE